MKTITLDELIEEEIEEMLHYSNKSINVSLKSFNYETNETNND